jgi:hypothetical protein
MGFCVSPGERNSLRPYEFVFSFTRKGVEPFFSYQRGQRAAYLQDIRRFQVTQHYDNKIAVGIEPILTEP